MAKDFYHFAKVAKFLPIWSQCSERQFEQRILPSWILEGRRANKMKSSKITFFDKK